MIRTLITLATFLPAVAILAGLIYLGERENRRAGSPALTWQHVRQTFSELRPRNWPR